MASLHTSASITVNCPIGEAFRVMTDLDQFTAWFTSAQSVQGHAGPLEMGTRYEAVVRFMGREATGIWTVVEYDPPHRIVIDSTSDMGEGTNIWHFAEEGSHVRITVDFKAETSGLLARVATPLLQGLIQKQMHADLARLKRLIEA
jgi:carbon monoxide dehydrogenase subunit G